MTVTKPFTIDSNILIYSADPADQRKHGIATRIVRGLASVKGPLALQCLNEFYRATTRPRKPILAVADAQLLVQKFLPAFEIIGAEESDLREAMRLHQSSQLQFFDALLIATTARAGCSLLLSEDMHDGLVIGTLTIRNPFAMTKTELDSLLS